MNIVRSKEKNDCGVCALATVTGRAWHEVRAAIWSGRAARQEKRRAPLQHFDENHSLLTTGLDLTDAAERLGWIGTRCKPCKRGWPELRDMTGCMVAIVKVQYQDVRCGHWVAYDGEFVYDGGDTPSRPWVAGNTSGYALKPLSYVLLAKNDL